MTTPTDQDSSLRDAESILQRLAATALDDDYYARRESPPPRRSKVLTGVVAGLFGLLLTVAAVQTRHDRPATELERRALVDNIQVRQDLAATKQETVARLQDELADLQAGSVQDSPAATDLAISAGSIAVTGPGVVLRVSSSADEEQVDGRLTDSDVQLIVNGMWLAGAEAVSVNGNRLTSTSAIRSAGEAITVNFRSVTEPIVVTALGNEETMLAQWEAGPSGRYLTSRANADGIRFNVRGSDDIELSAAPERRLSVSAEPLRRSAS